MALAVFPELALSAYAIDDLLLQDTLLDAVERALVDLVARSGGLCRCSWWARRCAMPDGSTTPPWQSTAAGCSGWCPRFICRITANSTSGGISLRATARKAARSALAGTWRRSGPTCCSLRRIVPGLVVHAEICEDLWVPVPPSAGAALAGATVLANLSASNITIGKAETRQLLCLSQSARCLAAYLYAAAGTGESTTDLAWDGQAAIYEAGVQLAATDRFPAGARIAIADVDLDLLRQERMRMGTFDDNRRRHAAGRGFRTVTFALAPPDADLGLRRRVDRFPFVPADPARLAQDCYEAYNIQVSGLVQRLRANGTSRLVIGVSGGLNSTQALLVAAQAFDLLGLPRTNLLGFTMPGFGTSDGTKANAIRLMEALGITWRELDIRPAARQMLADLDHPFARGEPQYDVTFENVQAGLRTDYLFRLANHHHGFVLGTGDLSELALGWCTYGVGDQMSHYNVNAGVPKTLIQHLIRWVIASRQFEPPVLDTLGAILATEISPELVPADAQGQIQNTEAKIGPYALQDFNLFYVLRYGFRPSKIAFLALHAWGDAAGGDWPPGFPHRAPARLHAGRDTQLAAGVPGPLLRLRAIQALGAAQRPEGHRRRLALATRRLAGPVGRQRADLAGGAGT